MAVVSLPLTFPNSFWSQDYRKGLETLYGKLEQGVAENDEIVAFITARVHAENQIASALLTPPAIGSPGTGFSRDDGASLLMAFRGLQDESLAQGKIHREIARDLQSLVAEPFDEWAEKYKERLSSSKGTALQTWVRGYEDAQKEVIKLKNTYLTKTRRADEAEDEARFAPSNDLNDHYTTSPRLAPRDTRTPQRSGTVSERISQRLKEIQRRAGGSISSTAESDTPTEGTDTEKELPKVDKGKGKAVEISSPPPMSPPLPPAKLDTPPSQPSTDPSSIVMAGIAFPVAAISSLLTRAAAEMPLRPVHFPLLGEYPECFSGAEFVEWLNKHVPAFEGSLDLAEDAARDLAEREGLLRHVGEFGNHFVHADDAYYQFRPKAFDLESKPTEPAPPKGRQIADNLLKRSNNLVNVVTKALNANSQGEPLYVRLRQEADEADKIYRVAVRKLDRQRLGLEERIEEVLKTLQRWEVERLRAVKTVLLQYQGTLANLPKAFEPTLERSATFIATYQPESDLTALIERYRTGPFRPVPQLYESVAHDESDVVFGIDLRKWVEGGWSALTSGEEKKDLVPPVLTALLDALDAAYLKLPNDSEKRKAWIYDIPLPVLHHLRESLNAIPPGQAFSQEMLAKYDAPVLAGCVKLWTLELDPPLALWEGWDDIRKLYPTVGATTKTDDEASEQQHIQDLQVALQRFPKVHLYVLNVIVSHLRGVIASTTTPEDDDVYISKLALSVGRTIIRPKIETELSIQDRHPTLLFIDLVKNYDNLLPPTIEKKKRESERKGLVRKRTAPVDMRMSRGKISVGTPTREILAAQQAAQEVAEAHSTPVAVAGSPVQITAEPESAEAETETETETEGEPEPEPESETETQARPDPAENTGAPPRPTFKEPPPELDDFPPRPSFREPPPEIDEPHASTRPPAFVSPPASPPPVPAATLPVAEGRITPSSSPAVAVTPATPQNPIKALRRNSAVRSSGSASPVRSPSPATMSARSGAAAAVVNEDQPLNPGRSGLSRHTSGQAVGLRGPRVVARGPRTPGGGSVSSMIANLNNRASTASPPPSPGYKRLSGGSRPTSTYGGSGRVGARGGLSRRTMASDAEDEVVEK